MLKHENEVIKKTLREEYADYPYNQGHYDREYRMIARAIKQAKNEEATPILADVSVALSSYTNWLWLHHNILTNAESNEMALKKYLATL